MEIKVRGQMAMADLRQAIFENLHLVESEHAVHFSKGATLYINPTNEHGEPVIVRGHAGRELKTLHVTGPYRSAADEFKI